MKNRLVLCNSAILGATHIARKSRDTKPMLTQNNITYIIKKKETEREKETELQDTSPTDILRNGN
jgi:hypothetical protein